MNNYEFVYDESKLDRIIDNQYPDQPDPGRLTIRFGYDSQNRLASYSASHSRYPEGYWSRSFTYDDNGRVIAIERYYSLNVITEQSDYVYNENSQLISYINNGSNTLTWYDGRIIRHTYSTGSMTYSYDESGRLKERADPKYRWVYVYNNTTDRISRINVYVSGSYAYYWDFTWEPGTSSFSMCDIEAYKLYYISFGWY